VTSSNPIREAFNTGRFSYIVELVASAKTTEERLHEIAAELARVPGIIAGGVTSYAGGSAGLDPIRVGEGVRARGLTPNVHITCVNHNRQELIRSLEELHAQDIDNVFAITGDYPKAGTVDPAAKVDYDLDSVQLVELIHEMRQQGMPFHISVAVSPFKYTEADCAYQYLKLEKKIAAGADFAITQLGYDVRKFRELKRYLDERGLKTPLFGNVYILPAGAAKKFSKGEPPGCWVSQELVEIVQEEAKAPDKGLAARLERAARTVAVLRGLGYAGAYIGGDHQAERIRWIIERSEAIASNWEEYAEELVYAPKDGFYFFDSPKPAPKKREFAQRVMDVIEPANTPAPLRSLLTGLLGWVDHHPSAAHALERAEYAFKASAFGCQACGNCVLGLTEYICPMTCPKNLRNGPCGGTLNGQCEVYPDRPCVWVKVYERAQAANRVEELKVYIPQRDRSLEGTSSYINYYLERDSRPDHPQPLVTISGIRPVETEKSFAKAESK
jgi:methylenetetrahydrofolate reductase (NADPH)